jgi:ubiquinone/menaquinone biosynthesis C-methylase UbiE
MPGKDARFWDRIARKYAANPIADEAGYERTLEAARRYLKNSDVVFEFGCGTGTTALRLAASVAHVVASDISAEMVAIGREKAAAQGCANVSFEVATLDTTKQSDAAFDAVLGFNVLHLVRDRVGALRAIHRLLKRGGVFISKTPCIKEANPVFRLAIPVMQLFMGAPHVGVFSTDDLEKEILSAGFSIVERARHGSKSNDARPFLVARKL